MYPRQFLDSFWSPTLRDEAFVAMNFDDPLRVYDDIIDPSCVACGIRPVRVDQRKEGDSIVTQILDGLAHSRIVLAEISTARPGDDRSRNGNVMWEVGVAHAFRQPSEVVLLRRDDDRLLFDIGPIRVHRYDPTDVPGARVKVEGLIRESLKATDLSKSLLVEKAIRALNPGAFMTLLTAVDTRLPSFEVRPTMLNQQTFPLLFALGVLELAPDATTLDQIRSKPEAEMLQALSRARLTAFGTAVTNRLVQMLGGLLRPSTK